MSELIRARLSDLVLESHRDELYSVLCAILSRRTVAAEDLIEVKISSIQRDLRFALHNFSNATRAGLRNEYSSGGRIPEELLSFGRSAQKKL